MRRSAARLLLSAAKQAQAGVAGAESAAAIDVTSSRAVQALLGRWQPPYSPPTCGSMHTAASRPQQAVEQAGTGAGERRPASRLGGSPYNPGGHRVEGGHRERRFRRTDIRDLEGGQARRQPPREPHPSFQGGSGGGSGSGSDAGSSGVGGGLFAQLESMNNAGDLEGVRRTFEAALYAAQREMERTGPGAKPPPALASPFNWRLYFLALEATKAHPMLVGSRIHTMHEFGVQPQVQAYVILIKRCSDGGMGNMAYSKIIEMKERGLPPTMSCFLHAITACLRSQQPGFCKRLFELLKASTPLCSPKQLTTFGKLSISAIREFARFGRHSYCFELMDDLTARRLRVPHFILTDVMHSAAAAGRTDALLECVRRLAAIRQHFQETDDPASKVVRPLKMDEGSLLEVLAVAANKGDAILASATWELLLRSLALPNSPALPGHAFKEGDEANPDEEEELLLEGSLEEAADLTEAPSGSAGADVAPAQAGTELATRPPLVVSYHALIHAYANAHRFGEMFQAIRELEAAHPGIPEAVAYYSGLVPAVDALAHSVALIDEAYYLLEGMTQAGEQVSAAMLNVVVAACSQVGDIRRALETFDQYGALHVAQDADAYNALLQGCVECGMVETMVKVLDEMRHQGVPPNAHTHQLLVERCIVSADVSGMMEALEGLEAAGHTPKTRLLERCVARCERAGDRENIRLLLERLFQNDYRIVGIDAMTKRWQPEGGMAMLTGSSRWVNRESVIDRVPSSKGKYFRSRGRSGQGLGQQQQQQQRRGQRQEEGHREEQE